MTADGDLVTSIQAFNVIDAVPGESFAAAPDCVSDQLDANESGGLRARGPPIGISELMRCGWPRLSEGFSRCPGRAAHSRGLFNNIWGTGHCDLKQCVFEKTTIPR
jgi:hypothetical protein